MVDMKAKPFNLSDEDCKWVEDTIAGMDTDEKIGQLFFQHGFLPHGRLSEDDGE